MTSKQQLFDLWDILDCIHGPDAKVFKESILIKKDHDYIMFLNNLFINPEWKAEADK